MGNTLESDVRQIFIKEIEKLAEVTTETEEGLREFSEQVEDMGIRLRQARKAFHDFIIRAMELIKLLPDYRVNVQQTNENREALHFDSALGENQ